VLPSIISIYLWRPMNPQFERFHQAEENFFSLLSTHKAHFKTVSAFATGVHASALNPVFVKELSPSLLTDLMACKSFYEEIELPWALAVPKYILTPSLERFLSEHGFSFVAKGIAMGLELSSLSSMNYRSELEAREMLADLDTWQIPIQHAFESTPAEMDIYKNRHREASQNGAQLYHYSGFIDGKVICSVSLSIIDNMARLDDGGTMPEYQNKGYASQLFYYLLNQLIQQNIHLCFLESSDQGFQLYQRFGFTSLFENYFYEPTS
jgi:ribosomal protein S18 acetylase RimI-like enzyme